MKADSEAVCFRQLTIILTALLRPYKQSIAYRKQRWARATSKVAPLPLPLLALKSSVATATRLQK